MAPAMQAAYEQFEQAKGIVSYAFAVPTGNAQAQLEQCDLECIQAIVAAAPLPLDRRLAALKDALAAAAGRRARMAAEDAKATVRRLETQAACRRVLEGPLGYTAELAFAALAVLSEAEQAQIAALDGGPVDVAAVQEIFGQASDRIERAESTPTATKAADGVAIATGAETPAAGPAPSADSTS